MMEYLRWLEWEWLSAPEEFDVRERGPMPRGIAQVRLERDPDLHLRVTGTGRQDRDALRQLLGGDEDAPQFRAGELIPPPPDVVAGRHGKELRVSGVSIAHSVRSGLSGAPEGVSIKVDAQASRATLLERDAPAATCTEWIVNFAFDPFLPSRGTDREEIQHFKRTRQGGKPFEMELPSQSAARDHAVVDIEIGGKRATVCFGSVPHQAAPKELKPGFIEYESVPTDEDARRFREMLSFLLGRRLAYIGSTLFGADGFPIQRNAEWPGGLFVRRGVSNASSPPTRDIGTPDVPFIAEETFATAMERLLRAAEDVDLVHSLGLYWLGQETLLDVAAAHLGAALESLRDDYASGTKGFAPFLLPKDEWRPVRDLLLQQFDEAVQADGSREPAIAKAVRIVRSKLSNLNEKSSNMKYDEFFEALGLQIGDVERSALRERNMPAHGSKYSNGDYPALVMRVHALRTLFNRCVLKIAGGVESYVDYSTLGHPSRRLIQPLGGPAGDGQPA